MIHCLRCRYQIDFISCRSLPGNNCSIFVLLFCYLLFIIDDCWDFYFYMPAIFWNKLEFFVTVPFLAYSFWWHTASGSLLKTEPDHVWNNWERENNIKGKQASKRPKELQQKTCMRPMHELRGVSKWKIRSPVSAMASISFFLPSCRRLCRVLCRVFSRAFFVDFLGDFFPAFLPSFYQLFVAFLWTF